MGQLSPRMCISDSRHAPKNMILGSEIRENWTRRINYLLSEKNTGFWADQYFSCVRQAEVYRAFLTCTKDLVRRGSIQLASGHVFAKRDASVRLNVQRYAAHISQADICRNALRYTHWLGTRILQKRRNV
jgi:hypothetical protein